MAGRASSCLVNLQHASQFWRIETFYDLSIDDRHGCCHVPSFSSSLSAASSAATFRSTNSILFCETNSFTFAQKHSTRLTTNDSLFAHRIPPEVVCASFDRNAQSRLSMLRR
jgi:hypothetical protein